MSKEKFERQLENFYLMILVIFLFRQFLTTTMFQIEWNNELNTAFYLVVCVLTMIKAGLINVKERQSWKLAVCFAAVLAIVWKSNEYTELGVAAILVIGSFGINYRKILKIVFWTENFALTSTIIGSFVGIVRDLIYRYDLNVSPKHSFGVVYTTDFAAHVFFLFLLAWVLYGEYSYIFSSLLSCCLAVCVNIYSGAKNSMGMLLLIAAASLYLYFKDKYQFRFFVHLEAVLCWVLPVFALMTLLASSFFDSQVEWMSQLNKLLSGRLTFGKNAIDQYGLHLWGSYFDMHGAGGENLNSWWYQYNFIDCSYVMIAVRYGLAAIGCLIGIFYWFGRKMLKCGQIRILIAVAIIAMHCTIEHHMLEPVYNWVLLILFADYEEPVEVVGKAGFLTWKKAVLLLSSMIVCIVLFKPGVLFLRTVFFAMDGWEISSKYRMFFIYMLLIMSGFALFFHWIWKGILFQKWKNLEIIAACVMIGIILTIGYSVMGKWSSSHAESYERECQILTQLLNTESISGVYADNLPLLYARKVSGLKHSIFREEGYSDAENIALITENQRELAGLLSNDFQYAEISEHHSIYTNSSEACQILKMNGYDVTAYYSTPNEINLDQITVLNDLRQSRENNIIIYGRENSIWHGPYITIYQGMMHMKYYLKISAYENPENIAAIKISGMGGKHILQTYTISEHDMDEDGMAAIEFDVYVPTNMTGMEFLLLAEDKTIIELEKIVWQKIG